MAISDRLRRHSRTALLLALALAVAPHVASAQTARIDIFVDDDPVGADYRDASYGVARDGDHLRLTNGTKMPVEGNHAHFGTTSGLIEYRHLSGSWDLFIASEGWPVYDLSEMDSLVFFINGPEAFAAGQLPRIGLEDGDKVKSDLVALADFADDVDGDVDSWQRIALPLEAFTATSGFQIDQVQTVRFAEGHPNEAVRTLWVDYIHATGEIGDVDPPLAPSNLTTRDGDRSVIVRWDPPESAVAGYRLYRAEGGGPLVELATGPISNPYYVDFDVENDEVYRYAVRSVDGLGVEGDLSDAVEAHPRVLSDGEFVDLVQRTAVEFFWYEGHSETGQVKDRTRPNAACSIAATGMGLTALTIGIDREWLEHEEVRRRVLTTLRSLWEQPQGDEPSGTIGYRGFFYHFLDCGTATRRGTSELSTIDTALLLGGVIDMAMYFEGDHEDEVEIRALADSIYQRVEWTWAQPRPPRIGHGWRPESGHIAFDYGGYNEAMILYLLALGSSTHPVAANAWGAWTSTYNWQTHYGLSFLVFPPLFGHQYTHLWFDFRGIADNFMRGRGIDYFENSRRATLANRAYAIANPSGYPNYGPDEWGLTASDIPGGYRARGAPPPQNDDGTLAPTAPGGSFAFTPDESLRALRTMYDRYRTELWGPYGFRDAYNVQQGWFARDYLGIDQGPIAIMIENWRTGAVWDRFMEHEAVQQGLMRAGFQVADVSAEMPDVVSTMLHIYPNPARSHAVVRYSVPEVGPVILTLYDVIGRQMATITDLNAAIGVHEVEIASAHLAAGVYLVSLESRDERIIRTFVKH